MNKTKSEKNILAYLILGFGGLVMLYPFIFGFMGSLTTPEEFAKTIFLPMPKSFGLERFNNLLIFFKSNEIINSVIITLLRFSWIGFIVIVVSVVVAYLFSKVDFYGKKIVFMLLMSSLMIPGVATLVPFYVLMSRFPLIGGNDIMGMGGHGFINEWQILFITGLVSAYNIFLIKQAFTDLGDEYKEAAEIDGAGFFKTVFNIYTPMIKPVILVVLIGLFIAIWNDYMFPLIYVAGNQSAKPVGLVVIEMINTYGFGNSALIPDYPAVFGISMIFMLPPILVYSLLQKQFVEGLTMGGVKS